MSTTNIYVLSLEDNRFYIGKSDNVNERYQKHLNGTGSAWTKKYKPIAIERIISNASPFDEDRYTKEYMSIYGISRVRGGSYVEVNLTNIQIEILEREIRLATDKCLKCGQSGHFIKNCFLNSHKQQNKVEPQIDENVIKIEFNSNENSIGTSDKIPLINIIEYTDTTSQHPINENVVLVNEKNNESTNSENIITPKNKSTYCYRCGRFGHLNTKCYAKTHKNGSTL
jgi:predicted GIY-YIG superfamily endonuclease